MKILDALEDLRAQRQLGRLGLDRGSRASREVTHRANHARAIQQTLAIGPHLLPHDLTGLLGESSTPKRSREEDDLEALNHSHISTSTPTVGIGKGSSPVTNGPRLPIIINGIQQDLLELLNSDDWKRHTADLHDMDGYMDAKDYEIPSDVLLQTTPKKSQVIGQEKLVKLARSMFRGGFLADPVGLGKSLTALLAALRIKMDHPNMGYILVVCRTGCLVQWFDEIRTHFAEERRPKALILDAPDYPVQDLLRYDVVICSQSYVRSRYKDVVAFETERASQITNSRQEAGRIKTSRPHWSLHSHLYTTTGTIIPAIIIDESQDAKGADSVLLKAIKSLQYHTAFLLSGTPVHNKWTDLYGQMSILPGCPFQGFDHFSETFCGVDSQGMLMQIPDNERQQLLIELLSGMVIKRPEAIVGLPEFQHT